MRPDNVSPEELNVYEILVIQLCRLSEIKSRKHLACVKYTVINKNDGDVKYLASVKTSPRISRNSNARSSYKELCITLKTDRFSNVKMIEGN